MKRTVYNKLVRDRIPQIIEASGRQAVVRTLPAGDRLPPLLDKLEEELAEYLQSRAPEELADLLEVIHGAAEAAGHTWEEVEALRLQKKRERGGFEEGTFLLEVIEP